MLSSRGVNADPDDGAGRTIALVVAWPALWYFSQSRRPIDAEVLSANRSLNELVITSPGLYRRDLVAVRPGGRG
ncbi:hypothetical protein [Sinorhizobium meliloti]|uniref:hypothetical protein n=1 Tax=Rhizobium meliloti TaxID=382 RepID=UPI0002A54CD8|nr:hypothetical protein [Sinorhizobium meliloti]AGA08969.1 hypothetical protein C770_GR4pC0236 [Sinorhizobium meliloti GR4]MDE3819609.1 hypothetical protein [Sinorhizobium meliloti]MDW9374013.1 hypothetical protein [Sinorhizobium meliloti]MDW9496554.1 hypothetical protein [Sinorhizobium meliloti]MDW9509084.1 hypothetical protein [Sinorhizobium meliloti]